MDQAGDTIIKTYSKWEQFLQRFRYFFFRIRCKFPHLVWYNQEVDVRVTLKGLGNLIEGSTVDNMEWQDKIGDIRNIQTLFREMGITFDSGSSLHGREWQWDFSLKGPISVQFVQRTKKPEVRTAIPQKKKLYRVK